MELERRRPLAPLTWATAALLIAACGAATTVGADSRWLAALGGVIARTGHIPRGVPYAVDASHGWHNVPVLGELAFYALERGLGDHGLVLAQIVAVSTALGLTARRAPLESVIVLLLVPLAALDSFVIARAQLFSLALFPLLVLLLRSESREPSRRIWLLVPLVALWSNLHGAVLIGLAVAAAYLVVERLRTDRLVALGVLLASGAAALATPAGVGTIAYYRGVFGNAWRSAHEGLWAGPSLHDPLDVIFVAALVPLALLAFAATPRLWEWVAAAGLAYSAATAARSEVWLVLFLAPIAVDGLRRARPPAEPLRLAVGLAGLAAAAGALALTAQNGLATSGSAGPALVTRALAAAHGTPILADPYDAEQVALHGGRIVIGDPIDAFDRREQLLYLHWLRGEQATARLSAAARVVLVQRQDPAQRRLARDPAFCRSAADRNDVLYVRCLPLSGDLRDRGSKKAAAKSLSAW